ncbi:MAG: site-specific DNA-methyltransferase [Acidaminococcus sp.]|nr:site-specific DNA-methyltransferase [Acidaminococcus sp.]
MYEDDFAQSVAAYANNSGQIDEDGNRLVQNTESNGRFHTDWLNMMYPRLKLAKDMLSKDGVIFISIDDNELENLLKICNEIFGEDNYQATITYVRKTSGKQDSTNFMKSTEFMLVYSRSAAWDCMPLIATDKVINRFDKVDDDGRKYRETDLRKTGTGDRRQDRPAMWYPFYFNPQTKDLVVREEVDQSLVNSGYIEIWPIKPDHSDGRWRWGYKTSKDNIEFLDAHIMPKYADEGKFTVYEKDYIDKNGGIKTVKEHTFWNRKEFNSDNAMKEFKDLGFSNQLFPFPKSSALMKHLVYLANCGDSIVMDFFSGSGTFAEGVMKINSEDHSHRRFILVQIPEKCKEGSDAFKAGYQTICDLGEERIKRAGKKIKEESPLTTADLDIGFRCFEVDSSNMKDVYYQPDAIKQDQIGLFEDNIKADRTPEDLLIQVMLDLGILLSSKVEEIVIDGKKVFSVDDGYLLACFDENVTDETVTEIAKHHPFYAVFRDRSMKNDSVLTNFEQIFATYSPETVRKVI